MIPAICKYWVGLWECVARNNPQASKLEAFDLNIFLFHYNKGGLYVNITCTHFSDRPAPGISF